MLGFFQKYQKIFFLFVGVIVIASFSFFGTFGAFLEEEKQDERVIGETLDGSPLKFSDVQLLARFLASEPNPCNDGVIQKDLLQTGIADLLCGAYFEPLEAELQARLDRAKRHRPYAHPEAPYLTSTLVWARFFPALLKEYQAFREEEKATPQTFSRLSHLYQQQRAFPPELLRRCLVAQQKQMGQLQPDPNLLYTDLSLFGFHTLADWFGQDFVDLAAEFILNAAAAAEMKGFQVSLEEAKGDLLRNFELSLRNANVRTPFTQHLRTIGFDEKRACEVWRKVLLFRRYFQGMSQAAFLDRLPYSDFASYALETAVINHYTWPLQLKSPQDRAEFDAYLQAISPEEALLAPPKEFYPLEEIENRFPGLVQTTYRAQVGEISKNEIALHASVQQVWDWQLEEKNWKLLKEKFSFLPDATSREDRFAALEKLAGAQRAKIDRFTRFRLLDLHPEWMTDAIAALPKKEQILSGELAAQAHKAFQEDQVSFQYSAEDKTICHVENLEKIFDRHLLTFEEAKKQGVLKASAGEAPDRILAWTRKAYEQVRSENAECRSKKEEEDPVKKQFQLIRTEKEIQRTGKEDWMKAQVFDMFSDEWSPIHAMEEGEVSFFFLREKRLSEDPILEQLVFGKQLISADAQRYLAERLLETAKKRNAIVIPLEGTL